MSIAPSTSIMLGLRITGRWGPPDFGRPICFMRINDKRHDVVLFELSGRCGASSFNHLVGDSKQSQPRAAGSRARQGLGLLTPNPTRLREWLLIKKYRFLLNA